MVEGWFESESHDTYSLSTDCITQLTAGQLSAQVQYHWGWGMYIHLDSLPSLAWTPYQRQLCGFLSCITLGWKSHSWDGLKGHLVQTFAVQMVPMTANDWLCLDLKLGLLILCLVPSLLSLPFPSRQRSWWAMKGLKKQRRHCREAIFSHLRFLLLLFAMQGMSKNNMLINQSTNWALRFFLIQIL